MPLHPAAQNDDIALEAIWQNVRGDLRKSIGARSFDHWLKPITFMGFCLEDHAIRLGLPSEFMASWVRSHHGERLVQAWRAAVPGVRSVQIEVNADTPAVHYSAPASFSETATPAEHDQFYFDPRLTFANFITGPTNAVAANAAQLFSTDAQTPFNSLYIYAQTGQGKTHLLQAIGHAYQQRRPAGRVLYMSAERFMFEFVTAMRARDTMAFKLRLRSADLLMIDDVQFIAGKESTQEEFLHTVDELMTSGKRLAISADRSPHALDGVEGRILSRQIGRAHV